MEKIVDIGGQNLHNAIMSVADDLLEAVARLGAQRNDKQLLMLIRRRLASLEQESPDLAQRISRTVSSAGGLGALREFRQLDNLPVDADTGMQLLQFEHRPYLDVTPVLDTLTRAVLDAFIKERRHVLELRAAGVKPPTSLALMGPPGTGKTTLTRWLALQLDVPLMTLNLGSAVTSYLGQTGQNLKKALDRARLEPCVLLLDEFDALARTRLEEADVVEMKRVVNVLLQEIENWPDQSVLVAATNLPELVDSAFRRRFSRWLRLPLPGETERIQILKAHYRLNRMPKAHLSLAAMCLDGFSGADLATFANRALTRQVLERVSPTDSLWVELAQEITERPVPEDLKGRFVRVARGVNPKRFTYRKLAELLGISHTTAMKLAKSTDVKEPTTGE